jgi:hypothetical protein
MNDTRLNNLRKMGGVTTLLASILAIANPADAINLVGNNTTTGSPSFTNISTITQRAVGFTLPIGSNYTLDNIVVRLANYRPDGTGNDNDFPLLQIYADSAKTSTDPNGATLQSVSFGRPDSAANPATAFTFTPTSTFTFLADTRYWLLVDVTAGNFRWVTTSPNTTPTSDIGVTNIAYSVSTNNGVNYTSGNASSGFVINATAATPVPFDFDPSLGVAVLGGGWLLRKHLKKKKSTKV